MGTLITSRPGPPPPAVGNQAWGASLPPGQINDCQPGLLIARGRHALKKHILFHKITVYLESSAQKQSTGCSCGRSCGGKAQQNVSGSRWVQKSTLLRDTCRLPESLAGVRAAWESGGLWAVRACCVLQPRELRDRPSYPKTALPGTPNGEDGKAAHTLSHATRAHSTCYTPSHVCTHSMAHTLTRNGWSHQHAFTCNTHAHDMLSHNMLLHDTCSPIHVHMFKMRAHTLPLHTHAHTHTCTHKVAWTHTDPQSRTRVLP